MAVLQLRENFFWVGVLDRELRVFDVVMRTEHGTTYNAYLLKTPAYTVLFETVKESFWPEFLANLRAVCDPAAIDYIVLNHTEPDHAGSLEKLLAVAPKAKVLATPVAHGFLRDICNRRIPGEEVRDNQVLQLDNCRLQFLSVPFLHWPDSMYTYIPEFDLLVSCDSFGAHYADERVCNDLITADFTPAFRYYFTMIMGPFRKHVRYALERLRQLPPLAMICPGHGPVLRKNIPYYLGLYERWSREDARPEHRRPLVVNAYVSAYGYTAELGREIVSGVAEEIAADVRSFDMVTADAGAVAALLAEADGILVGSCTINGDVLPPVMDLLMRLNGIQHGGKVAGAYGSYGWSGEAAEMLTARLKVLRMEVIEPPCRVVFKPAPKKLAAARRYGIRFGRKLKEHWEAKKDPGSGRIYWQCTVCGEIFEGALPPGFCPVCGAGAEAFVAYTPPTVSFRREAPVRVVIVGSGIAAVAAAKAVRSRNPAAEIAIYSRETILPYHRPMLSKGLLTNTPDRIFYLEPEEYYREQRIELHLGRTMTRIDRSGHRIILDDGTAASYDKLVLATGARCFVPPISGHNRSGVYTLREQADLVRIKAVVRGHGSKNIVVIGGGLLGLECAHYLTRLGHRVTVIESCPCLLPRQLDPEGGMVLQEIMVAIPNLHFINGVRVEEIGGRDAAAYVRMTEGDPVDCDLVIISTGVVSNKEPAEAAGLPVDRAIVVDERMHTYDPDIYAAGDCAVCNRRFDGIWETALEQGTVAGANLAGEELTYQPKVFGATLQAFGTSLFSVGVIPAPGESDVKTVAVRNEAGRTYRKLFFRSGRLCGGILLGDVSLTRPLLHGVAVGATLEEAGENGLLPS
ncbi:MAG: FAD-dependent oxidoreductase [Victivallales bacterium]|nr:FAD-dependent oxidoreductase [Victivallales bacterium]